MYKLVNDLLDEYDKVFMKKTDDISDDPPETKHKKSNKVMKPSDFSENKIQEYLRTGQVH